MNTRPIGGQAALLCLFIFSVACHNPTTGSGAAKATATVAKPTTTTASTTPAPSTSLSAGSNASPAPANFSVSRSTLSTGRLYVPARYAPTSKIDIMVHFHGYDPVVEREFNKANIDSALVIVNYNGFSSVYSGPFSNNTKLEDILNEAVRETATARNVANPTLGKVILCAFSAGYGATREILKSGRYDSLISDVVLIDGLHSGYVSNRQPNPTTMKPFLDYALKASRGMDARMIISHSSIVPYTYASTTETADYLIAGVGAASIPESGLNSAGMTKARRSDLGYFHVHGFTGGVAQDHVDQLQNMGLWLKRVSLAK